MRVVINHGAKGANPELQETELQFIAPWQIVLQRRKEG